MADQCQDRVQIEFRTKQQQIKMLPATAKYF